MEEEVNRMFDYRKINTEYVGSGKTSHRESCA
jgi:hypothetical protein